MNKILFKKITFVLVKMYMTLILQNQIDSCNFFIHIIVIYTFTYINARKINGRKPHTRLILLRISQ